MGKGSSKSSGTPAQGGGDDEVKKATPTEAREQGAPGDVAPTAPLLADEVKSQGASPLNEDAEVVPRGNAPLNRQQQEKRKRLEGLLQ